MGAFKTYERFFKRNNIPFTRLSFFHSHEPKYIGDRIDKLDLIAETIDNIEADTDNGSGEKQYIFIGHSFGGLNTCDFLVELAGGHVSGTPEGKIFQDTNVRSWPEEKKQAIFNRIKGVIFINTFIQGDKSSETNLKKLAVEYGITDPDPVGYAINLVFDKYMTGESVDSLRTNDILHFVLRTQQYRVNYYMKDKNNVGEETGRSIQNAFDEIASTKAIISVCSVVPRILPDIRVGTNLLVHSAKKKWQAENTSNDGEVDTYGGIFPRQSVDYVVLKNMDHGTVVMKPGIAGITTGHRYDQLPFLKTLLKKLESKLGGL